MLYSIKHQDKHLAVMANVIIVLSETIVGLGFGDDERQEFIWVDNMEAIEYAKKIHPTINDQEEILFILNVIALQFRVL